NLARRLLGPIPFPPAPQIPRPLPRLLLRPPRHPKPLPRMRYNSCQGEHMKRLWRIFFNALTVLSLLLCLATAVLWVRTYLISDELITANATGKLWWLSTYQGGLSVEVVHGWPNPEPLRWFRGSAGGHKRPSIVFITRQIGQYP